jgi:NAD(P)-dependent dehydrogenase (short-subunit alcohol dehydrogenase family)
MSKISEYYQDKVAVITGGASGVGLALAETLLTYGAKRIVLGDVSDENIMRETARLDAIFPNQVLGLHCDVTEEAHVGQMIRQAAEFGDGRVDFLFNNAGAGFAGVFDQQSDSDWNQAFALNFFGALYGIRAVLPIMRA